MYGLFFCELVAEKQIVSVCSSWGELGGNSSLFMMLIAVVWVFRLVAEKAESTEESFLEMVITSSISKASNKTDLLPGKNCKVSFADFLAVPKPVSVMSLYIHESIFVSWCSSRTQRQPHAFTTQRLVLSSTFLLLKDKTFLFSLAWKGEDLGCVRILRLQAAVNLWTQPLFLNLHLHYKKKCNSSPKTKQYFNLLTIVLYINCT